MFYIYLQKVSNIMEEWRDIEGYEGLYQASTEGRIKSLSKTWICGKGSVRHEKEKILKQHSIWSGYLRVCLSKDGENKWFLVHRLVANSFIPNPNGYTQVNHKDECKTNNKVQNLEWCSPAYNINYGTRTDRISKPIEAIDDNDVVVYKFKSLREARRNGFADSNILSCIKGKYKKSYGLRWRYTKKGA